MKEMINPSIHITGHERGRAGKHLACKRLVCKLGNKKEQSLAGAGHPWQSKETPYPEAPHVSCPVIWQILNKNKINFGSVTCSAVHPVAASPELWCCIQQHHWKFRKGKLNTESVLLLSITLLSFINNAWVLRLPVRISKTIGGDISFL